MDKMEFEKLVAEAIDELPQKIRDKMDNVAVVVEDWPSQQQLRRGNTPVGHLLFGLYEGVPRTKRGPSYTMVLPDKITIFQKSIEAVARTPAAIKAQVRETVWHEIAHHFGFSEAAVRDLSHRRRHI
jgi:predicted Zn-dependent protease with MMP-like domain